MDFSKIEVKSPKRAVNNKRKREDDDEMVKILRLFTNKEINMKKGIGKFVKD